MLRRAAALLLIGASIAAWVACTSTKNHFVYLAVPGANEVSVYREDPNSGILTAIVGSPYTIGTASSPQSLVLDPTQKFLYVANSQEGDISLFTVANDGTLAEVTPRTLAGTTPILLAMDPGGSFLYVANAGSNNISVFSIDSSSGALTPVTGSPTGIGIFPISMKIAPSGNFLYVGGSGSPGIVEVFSLSSGVLSAVGAFQTGTNPFGLEIDPSGSFLYTANTGDSSISEFSIGADGTLTQLAGSPVGEATGNSAPVAIAIDPSGTYLYVCNEGTSNIAGYTLSSGAITALSQPTFGTGTHPYFLAFDPNGKYVLISNQSGSVQNFGLDNTDGVITEIASYSTGSTPTSIAVKQ